LNIYLPRPANINMAINVDNETRMIFNWWKMERAYSLHFSTTGHAGIGHVTCLSDFGYLYPFRRYSRSNFEVIRNRPKFCTFLAPNFFGEGPPNFGT